jgi:hypothetical protein
MAGTQSIAQTIAVYRDGRLPRRDFLQRLLSFGVVLGVAASLATVYGNEAWAVSSKGTDAVAAAYDYIIVGAGSAGAALAYRPVQQRRSVDHGERDEVLDAFNLASMRRRQATAALQRRLVQGHLPGATDSPKRTTRAGGENKCR